jgi:hypothetical protein
MTREGKGPRNMALAAGLHGRSGRVPTSDFSRFSAIK